MKENPIKKIYLKSYFNVAKNYLYESYNFIFDFEKNEAYFEKKERYEFSLNCILNDESRNIFKNIHSFYTEECFNLNNFNINKLNSVINTIKDEYEENPLLYCELHKMVFYGLWIEYYNQENEYFKFHYDEIPSELFELFKKELGFDIFNLDNIKHLVTEKDFDINKNNIYDKKTGKELILKKIDYTKDCIIQIPTTRNSFHLDFDKQELITHNGEKIKFTDADSDNILHLIKKYGIYKWNSVEYSKKAINNKVMIYDGCSWMLSLVFDGGNVLNLGGINIQHDTYMEFGKELFEIFGIDLIDIESVLIK